MYRRFHTLLFVLATFLLMAVAAACVEPLTPDEPKLDPKAVTLPIRIYLPATGIPATKAGDEKGGEKSGTDDPVKAAAFKANGILCTYEEYQSLTAEADEET